MAGGFNRPFRAGGLGQCLWRAAGGDSSPAVPESSTKLGVPWRRMPEVAGAPTSRILPLAMYLAELDTSADARAIRSARSPAGHIGAIVRYQQRPMASLSVAPIATPIAQTRKIARIRPYLRLLMSDLSRLNSARHWRLNHCQRLVSGAGREAHVQGSIVRATRKPTPLDQWPVSSE